MTMKHISKLALAVASTFVGIPTYANAQHVSPLHASAVVSNNIAVHQHSIMLNAFKNFGGGLSSAIAYQNRTDTDTTQNDDRLNQYGKMPIYGEKLNYGEYGDDGTVFSHGRNGGDGVAHHAATWLEWQHTDDKASFDNFDDIDSRSDLLSLGFSRASDFTSEKFSKVGGFGGVIVAHEDADIMKLTETGGHIGVYYGYHNKNLNIQTAANMGTLFTDAKSDYYKNDFSNLWLGAAANVSYDIMLEDFAVLQPGLYAGYTWVKTLGYNIVPGQNTSVSDFNILELSPSVRAATHIAYGWFAGISARYVFEFTDGGTASGLDELGLKNYGEYGLSLEKNLSRFNISAMINRRDGGRTGWNGGVHIKCIF